MNPTRLLYHFLKGQVNDFLQIDLREANRQYRLVLRNKEIPNVSSSSRDHLVINLSSRAQENITSSSLPNTKSTTSVAWPEKL
jgi:hypothetical protein